MPELIFERVPAFRLAARVRAMIADEVPRSSGDIEKIIPSRIDLQSGAVIEYLVMYWARRHGTGLLK
jgi:hypothetical protein